MGMIVIPQSGTEANQSEPIRPNPIKKELICFMRNMAYKEDMMITKRKGRIMINSAFILHSCSDNLFCVFNRSYLHTIKIDEAYQ